MRLSRFRKTGKEAGIDSEQVVLGGSGNGTVAMGEGEKEKGPEIPDGEVGEKPGRRRPKVVTAHFMVSLTLFLSSLELPTHTNPAGSFPAPHLPLLPVPISLGRLIARKHLPVHLL